MMNKSKSKTQRLTTSIKIDPEVWKKARIGAINNDITLSELLEDAIKEWIKKRDKN